MSSTNGGVNDIIQKVLDEIKEMSTLNQILIGGTAGLTTGFVLSRVGKLAAFSIGSSVILLQIAQHSGYIEIKFGKKSRLDDLKKKAIKAAEEVGLPVRNQSKLEKILTEAKSFLQENISFGASYVGGCLIGIAI